MTTYRELLSSLTDDQLDQPVRYFPEESAPIPVELMILKDDLGYPEYDDSCVDSKESFEQAHGIEILKREWKVVWPKGTVFLVPSDTVKCEQCKGPSEADENEDVCAGYVGEEELNYNNTPTCTCCESCRQKCRESALSEYDLPEELSDEISLNLISHSSQSQIEAFMGNFGALFCRIYSGHGYWRPEAKGYTDQESRAWVLRFNEAYEATKHCGPEKYIVYKFL